jgi:hypothetical protein
MCALSTLPKCTLIRAKKYINFMSQNKYIFNILDFFYEKYKQKNFIRNLKF